MSTSGAFLPVDTVTSRREGIVDAAETGALRTWRAPEVAGHSGAGGLRDADRSPKPRGSGDDDGDTTHAENGKAGLSPLTAERIEQIEQQAREAGYERGLEEGRAAARRELERHGQAFASLLEEIQRPLADLDDEIAEQIAGLAATMTRRLVRREISADPAQIVGVVREALALLPSSERRITLHLHPQDARLVRELLQLDELERPWRIVEEPTLARGGLRLLTEHSEVDATLETRLGAVIASVMGDDRDA